MNNDSQFENRLRQQSLKPIPGKWREDILRQATRAVETRSAASVRRPSVFEFLRTQLALVLSPTPRAWATLATLWVAILGLNLIGGPDSTTGMAAPIPAAQTQLALKQKQLLLAELAGPTETPETDQSHAPPPGPRSQRRERTSVT